MWFYCKIVDPEVRLPGFHSQLYRILLLGPCKLLPLPAQLPDLANNSEGYPVKSIADKQQICLQYWGHAYSKYLFIVYLQLKFHWHPISGKPISQSRFSHVSNGDGDADMSTSKGGAED